MARVPSRYATAMRGRLEGQEDVLKSAWSDSVFVGLTGKECIDCLKVTRTQRGYSHREAVFSHSRFTESHRFNWIWCFFVFVSVQRKRSDHLYKEQTETRWRRMISCSQPTLMPNARHPPCLWRYLWAWRDCQQNLSAPKYRPYYMLGK